MGLEKTLLVFGIFSMLLLAYGVGAASLDGVQASLTNIFSPVNPPSLLFQNPKGCSFFDVGCNSANVALATEQIAVAVEYPGILIFTIIGRISTFISIINGALFGSLATSSTVPFLGLFEVIILLGAAIEIFRLARGNSGSMSGSTA